MKCKRSPEIPCKKHIPHLCSRKNINDNYLAVLSIDQPVALSKFYYTLVLSGMLSLGLLVRASAINQFSHFVYFLFLCARV